MCDEYITMKAVKTILKTHPFLLEEDEATALSRYIVEDSANEYVYWDEDNEIQLSIAKSILRAFVGEYELPELDSTRKEWLKIRGIYLTNLMAALHTLAPRGAISLEKYN